MLPRLPIGQVGSWHLVVKATINNPNQQHFAPFQLLIGSLPDPKTDRAKTPRGSGLDQATSILRQRLERNNTMFVSHHSRGHVKGGDANPEEPKPFESRFHGFQ